MLLCKSSPLSVLLLIKVNYPATICCGHFSFGLLLHGGPATARACSRFGGTLSLFPAEYSLSGTSTSTLVEFIALGSTKSPVTERAGKPILLQSLVPGILPVEKTAPLSRFWFNALNASWRMVSSPSRWRFWRLLFVWAIRRVLGWPRVQKQEEKEVTGRQILTIEIKMSWQTYKIGVGCIQR